MKIILRNIIATLKLLYLFQRQYQIFGKRPGSYDRGGEGDQGGAAEHPAVAVHGGAGEGGADEEPRLPQG